MSFPTAPCCLLNKRPSHPGQRDICMPSGPSGYHPHLQGSPGPCGALVRNRKGALDVTNVSSKCSRFVVLILWERNVAICVHCTMHISRAECVSVPICEWASVFHKHVRTITGQTRIFLAFRAPAARAEELNRFRTFFIGIPRHPNSYYSLSETQGPNRFRGWIQSWPEESDQFG